MATGGKNFFDSITFIKLMYLRFLEEEGGISSISLFSYRSILTVPWVELGGECNISCSKSGYSANIVFHTKPFYGGKKHRITAEIL